MDEPLGLIAGEGVFPFLVAAGAKAAGRRVVCVGLSGIADPEIAKHVSAYREVGLLRMGEWSRFLRKHGVREAIMVGRVQKRTMFAGGRIKRWLQSVPDVRTLSLYVRRIRHDARTHAVLEALADELKTTGVTLIDSTTYTQSEMASEGLMTKREPSARQQADADFGWPLCQTLSRMDIGQALTIIDKDVIAVEAMEGTNAMLKRSGDICRTPGWTLIKVSNVKQDMRFDVPSIGVHTIETLHASGGGCIVLETGKVIMLEKDKVLAKADELGVAILGRGA